MSTGFLIARNTLSPALSYLRGRLAPEQQQGFLLAWGRAVAVQAQRNALAKGGRRLWRDLARSVNVRTLGPDGVEVFSSHVAAAQKQFGGPIEAPGKGPGSHGASMLTIPIRGSRAEGKTVAEFEAGGDKLFVLGKQDGERGGILCATGADGAPEHLFILTKRTKPQRAQPWFPDDKTIADIGEHFAQKKIAAL